MSKGGGQPRAVPAGLAAAGVVVGHWLAYAVREPDAGARAVLLEATGHHVLPQLTVLALLAGTVALAAAPLRARRRVGARSFGRLARTLALLQVGGFLALELAERTVVHGDLSALAALADPTVLVGVLAQVAVGGALAALLLGVLRLAPRRRARALPTPPVARPAPRAVRRPTDRPGRGVHTLRGPPLLSRV